MMAVSFSEKKVKGVCSVKDIRKYGLINASRKGGVVIADLEYEAGGF